MTAFDQELLFFQIRSIDFSIIAFSKNNTMKDTFIIDI